MKEEWKAIEGYEGLYEVSNLGRVRNPNKILKLDMHGNGYPRIGLHKNGEAKSFLVHRLVAKAFIENPNNYPCVNHKDETRDNNNVSNLEWCSYSYNNKYGTCQERMVETVLAKNKPFRCVETGDIFYSKHECNRKTGIDRRTIARRLKGLKYNSKELHFEYIEG